jgi:hypothetical protein
MPAGKPILEPNARLFFQPPNTDRKVHPEFNTRKFDELLYISDNIFL